MGSVVKEVQSGGGSGRREKETIWGVDVSVTLKCQCGRAWARENWNDEPLSSADRMCDQRVQRAVAAGLSHRSRGGSKGHWIPKDQVRPEC